MYIPTFYVHIMNNKRLEIGDKGSFYDANFVTVNPKTPQNYRYRTFLCLRPGGAINPDDLRVQP